MTNLAHLHPATQETDATVRLTRTPEGVAILTIDCPDRPVNVFTAALTREMQAAIEVVANDKDLIGAVIASGKAGFMAGADLKALHASLRATGALDFAADNRMFRRMETCGKPFAAAIEGLALGGGLEIALACHYRVVADLPDLQLGLPEVTVGLLPAGGGTQRLPRMIGIAAALPIMLEGKPLSPRQALALGVVDAVVAPGSVLDEAVHWVATHPDARQPWDRDGYTLPGGVGPLAPHVPASFYAGMAKVRARTHGNYPAPLAILSAVYEGTMLPFEQGLRIEAAHAAALAADPVARNLIRTQFVNRRHHAGLALRPAVGTQPRTRRLAVVGAGMMGAGIALVAARAGIDVVLLDRSAELALAAHARIGAMASRQPAAEPVADLLARIRPTADFADLQGSDMVIEAVFESRAVKAQVFALALPHLSPDTVVASNTSTLPITGLAALTDDAERFVGLHFFSPVDRMPLVEVIVGEHTAPATLARAMDLVQQLRKTPIVVHDSPGFYTSRVFCSFVDEGMAMLREGVPPALIENAARAIGMATGPLAVLDEVSLDLQQRVIDQAVADGLPARFLRLDAQPVVARMNALGRLGRKQGGGFYDYPADAPKTLWAGLRDEFPVDAEAPGVDVVKQRLLYIQALEAARCLEEGVITAPADADLGSTLGIGFPTWTGGPLSLIDTLGAAAFVTACDALADRFGERFRPSPALRGRADRNQPFYAEAA
jgi:3-hydroxyacyl-CoA dehydrogenase/enoyl-CoA hydratase/3-hydroxybutyryl-CoA epimerase